MEGSAMLVGVIGAGVMGRGVADVVASSGHHAVIIDLDEKTLVDARAQIATRLKASALMRSVGNATTASILGRMSFTTSYDLLAHAEIVIENVSEITSAKRSVYAKLSEACSRDVVFAANSSTIPIGEIAEFVTNPSRVLGLHFMNPVSSKHLVEVIRGSRTSDQAMGIASRFLTTIGKSGIVVNDAPGFVSNRVLMLTINEAVRSVQDGVSTAVDVDRIFVGCFGHPMGPLATADLIGLDTIVLSLESLRDRLRDEKYKPVDLLKSMVDANQLGRKTGHGFFDYL